MRQRHKPEQSSDDLFPEDLAQNLAFDATLPTLQAARSRIAAVRPAAFARTRNALGGAVSALSPYITHGFVTLEEVLGGVSKRHTLDMQHKFVYELGWREFFRHVWQQQDKAIFTSLHEGPLPEQTYAEELPADIREGRTGVPVVDRAVRELYATGTLHNHARMWLASYVVHLRKVHWRAGADWLYAHLLDGDLASNHLSWQWVAGTGSSKPYLFNAENVARYAPPDWHSPGSIVDTSYEMLDKIARSPAQASGNPRNAHLLRAGLTEPPLLSAPPAWISATAPEAPDAPDVPDVPDVPDAAGIEGREVWLLHPWNLGELPADLPPDTVVIALFLSDFHDAWPWDEARWRFVGTRMAELASVRWYGNADCVGKALRRARRVRTVGEPHLRPWLAQWAECEPTPMLFPAVDRPCTSFSQWWTRTTRGLQTAAELLALIAANKASALHPDESPVPDLPTNPHSTGDA
ncbi:FAD-binding domain-containing protein [Herbaspirillum sp. RTI4]|uniref:FAD-binding domain-containing protein n=1 Tax=Herbaspirillum sp. RTI4 TaxID=3048640 RepID=UPI002AB4D9CC|nr:FAD-binding domain-containing protein [Herbaspirillum sp. RTI4]MDY7578792.1 FAD-binding domain-containing protein [Herbaspirillum sp. RTI4]MEA9982287.1 FAD-binding domain-containing protein [Herbaspirillum sp. RTI4]